MFIHDFIEVILGDVVAYFVHCCHNILRSNIPRAISIELVEYCLQFVVVHEGLHV